MLNAANATWNRGRKLDANEAGTGQLRMFSFESESEWLVYIFVSHLLAASSDRDEIHVQRISQILFQDGSFRSSVSFDRRGSARRNWQIRRETRPQVSLFRRRDTRISFLELGGRVTLRLLSSLAYLNRLPMTTVRKRQNTLSAVTREREREREARSWTPWPLSRMFCGFLRMGRMLIFR